VVFATDPIGQGEREQTYDPQLSGALAGWSVPEHIQAGAQSLLVGESAARFLSGMQSAPSITWSIGRM
jgi:hypothetical protein